MRQSIGWTVAELAELADISETTIRRIEEDARPFRFNLETASSLAAALDVPVSAIFPPEALTHLGRSPHTGKSCHRTNETVGAVCPSCFVQLPATKVCDTCGPQLTLVAG